MSSYDKEYSNEYDENYYYKPQNETYYNIIPDLPEYFLAVLLIIACAPTICKLCNFIVKDCILNIQKNKALKSKILTSDDEENLLNECSICLEQYKKKDKIVNLSCNHNFHTECINGWISKNNKTCPNCRENIM